VLAVQITPAKLGLNPTGRAGVVLEIEDVVVSSLARENPELN
jgi:hypothetical protein